MLIFEQTSWSHLGSVAHMKWILFELPKMTPGCSILCMLLHTQSVSSHLIVGTPVIYTGTCSLLSIWTTFSGICLFSVDTTITSPIKEDFHAPLIDFYGTIVLIDNTVVPTWFNVKINLTFSFFCQSSLVTHVLLWDWHYQNSVLTQLCTMWIYSDPDLPRIFLVRSSSWPNIPINDNIVGALHPVL